MTNTVRGVANATNVSGTVMGNVTFIHVNWLWIILPVVTVLLTILLLVLTIIENNRHGRTVWKASSLALLFHGLDGFDEADLVPTSNSQMAERARNMRGRLERNADGQLKFVNVGPKVGDGKRTLSSLFHSRQASSA